MNFLKIPVPFFRRKVRQRTSLKKYHFIFAKFLRFRRTFYKKFFGRGLGRTAPTDNDYKKTRCKPRFFNLSEYVGTAVPNLRFKGLFVKSPLKIRTHLSFGERCRGELRSKKQFILAKLFKTLCRNLLSPDRAQAPKNLSVSKFHKPKQRRCSKD